ncbi:zinc finger CCCH domain-containing protein 3 [Culicoides brevitarsis]|uniref:zinc finger CCCH domain-containing protein 3 n=1 Tax=Culicoides brevitarsis TaxID=469753 RepID=UPI00307B96C9
MSRPKIYVNPNFQPSKSNTQVHINPNFVPKAIPTETVHVNPLFLQLKQTPAMNFTQNPTVSSFSTASTTTEVQPLIRKTRHKLLRIKNTPATSASPSKIAPQTPQMIKVGRNKLIKANIYKESLLSKTKPKPGNMYKVDNRASGVLKKPLTSSKVVKKSIQSRHKTLQLKKINGTVYRASKNRLERQRTVSGSVQNVNSVSSKHSDRLISLNGAKYILKENGKRLIPIVKAPSVTPSSSKTSLEIAGIRFLQLMDGTYVRHHTHSSQKSVARQHLTTSKHKSIKILTKKLRKCNIPCPVYRRIGKCLAFTRGRCPKLHDPKYVDICSAALRKGGCTKIGCLMSHDLSLSKMPACKYYLQGCCVNDNCPYLHHKLNENVPICPEFAKGYCELAEKCEMRHEHPEVKQKSRKMGKRKVVKEVKIVEEATSSSSTRYFLKETEKSEKTEEEGKEISIFSGNSENDETQEGDSRPPIGSMPAFIPI